MSTPAPKGFGGRRLIVLLIVLGLIAVPGALLRVFCVGASCTKTASVASAVPFCSLPSQIRTLIGNGFRTGRSADVLAVGGPTTVEGGTGWASDAAGVPWPGLSTAGTQVPLVFLGTGVRAGPITEPVSLDDVAPTEAAILGLHRPHPEVRSGHALAGVATGEHPRLLMEIAITGISSENLSSWPHLTKLMSTGASTMAASTGSMPVDPAAVLTTLGTGGLPYQHGITGAAIRADNGRVTLAWGERAPVPVIATLGDDLDRAYKEKARIGLVAPHVSDWGAIGGNWYLGSDQDDVDFDGTSSRSVPATRKMLSHNYGADAAPDFMVTVLDGRSAHADAALSELIAAARKAASGSVTVVITGTGEGAPSDAVTAKTVADRIAKKVPTSGKLVAAASPQGLFLNQHTVATDKVSEDDILNAVESMPAPDGRPLMDQVFPALAVSFERYC
ncbi:MAG: hypothetical protein QOC87_611 [Actinomycetota bacterium]|nr:hypothetical protein [Actinomycetota bacterium]